jgi:hypothetical protein
VEAFGNALLRQCEPILSSPPHENGSSSDRKRLASSTAGAAAAPLWHWQRRFEDVAPGSVLRLSLADTAAELAVEAGEHEAIELWSSSALRAQRGDNPAHGGGTLGAPFRVLLSRPSASPAHPTWPRSLPFKAFFCLSPCL